ncbi:stefin-C-like [Epinephelus lanceolatus]|uniref:cystatin-B-like n=1 Tax=Epinephelus lanceolatus TaxID=310571 RepID=UPI001446F4E3|nr:cystatin-B-like [Epinephelus lanceolatus]
MSSGGGMPEADIFAWSETKDANEGTQEFCDKVKGEVVKQTGQNFADYKAVKYRNKNLCGGEHFVIKVQVGETDYIHLYVTRVTGIRHPESVPPSLQGVQQNKTKEDPLEPF